ncbi:HepT-like ribonuclease domain-containing protein [Methanospirillum purgamenti]|uniref:DUF86 domain-containing protein n=1 Tax=Methanospirillum hungatei TaxID=2203 RepID=A0A8F5VN15_METHU|nr:HepT-like ribonuclease domain-containing protein [Methanospirillum hungatei]QXO95156.1 DUF86 domain-containing protein [Methanospirillum hungatei]
MTKYNISLKADSLLLDDIRLDPDLSRSIPRSIEIIGEAVKNLSPTIRDAHPEIPWSAIAGMRDKLIHGYFGIKWIVVWSVIKNDLPDLNMKIRKIIEKMRNE